MSRLAKPLCAVALLGLLAGTAQAPARPHGIRAAAHAFNRTHAFADLKRQVAIGPRSSGTHGARAEINLIKRRLHKAGLHHLRVQHRWRNVIVRIPGKGRGTVIIGAHHDTVDVPGFVGANDGASGVAVLLEMARVLPRPLPGPSVTLVFLDGEEPRGNHSFNADGTRGSRQFVRYARRHTKKGRHGSPRLGSIRAMFLLDMVGDCDLHIPRERNSTRPLYRRLKGSAFGGRTAPILDDHIPFLRAGIPAVDLIDPRYGPPGGSFGAWWHTPQDSLDKVCPGSLNRAGRATIRALATL